MSQSVPSASAKEALGMLRSDRAPRADVQLRRKRGRQHRREGETLENFVFDDAIIEPLLATEAVAPSGAACLTLACQHRTALLASD